MNMYQVRAGINEIFGWLDAGLNVESLHFYCTQPNDAGFPFAEAVLADPRH